MLSLFHWRRWHYYFHGHCHYYFAIFAFRYWLFLSLLTLYFRQTFSLLLIIDIAILMPLLLRHYFHYAYVMHHYWLPLFAIISLLSFLIFHFIDIFIFISIWCCYYAAPAPPFLPTPSSVAQITACAHDGVTATTPVPHPEPFTLKVLIWFATISGDLYASFLRGVCHDAICLFTRFRSSIAFCYFALLLYSPARHYYIIPRPDYFSVRWCP